MSVSSPLLYPYLKSYDYWIRVLPYLPPFIPELFSIFSIIPLPILFLNWFFYAGSSVERYAMVIATICGVIFFSRSFSIVIFKKYCPLFSASLFYFIYGQPPGMGQVPCEDPVEVTVYDPALLWIIQSHWHYLRVLLFFSYIIVCHLVSAFLLCPSMKMFMDYYLAATLGPEQLSLLYEL